MRSKPYYHTIIILLLSDLLYDQAESAFWDLDLRRCLGIGSMQVRYVTCIIKIIKIFTGYFIVYTYS